MGHWGQPNKLATWTSYQIRKIAGCACTGNAGNASPASPAHAQPSILRIWKEAHRMNNSHYEFQLIVYVQVSARLFKSLRSGVTLCFQFVSAAASASAFDIWDKESIGLGKCAGFGDFFFKISDVFFQVQTLLDISQEWLVRLTWNKKEVHRLDSELIRWSLTSTMIVTLDFSRLNFEITVYQELLSDRCETKRKQIK